MKLLKTMLVAALLLWMPASFGELAVIVHKSNTDELDVNFIQMVFLGKTKGFPSAGKAVPLDLPENTPVREIFLKQIARKSKAQFTAYWAKLMFTGKGVPPKIVKSEASMVELVSKNPNIIGYVDAANVTDNVRVIARF